MCFRYISPITVRVSHFCSGCPTSVMVVLIASSQCVRYISPITVRVSHFCLGCPTSVMVVLIASSHVF